MIVVDFKIEKYESKETLYKYIDMIECKCNLKSIGKSYTVNIYIDKESFLTYIQFLNLMDGVNVQETNNYFINTDKQVIIDNLNDFLY